MPYSMIAEDSTLNKKNLRAASLDFASPFLNPTMMIAGMLMSSMAIKIVTRSRALAMTRPPRSEHSIKK